MSFLGYSSILDSYGGLLKNNSSMVDASSSLNRDLDINPKVSGMPSQTPLLMQLPTQSCAMSGMNQFPSSMGIGEFGGIAGLKLPEIQYRPKISAQQQNVNSKNNYQLHWRNKTDKQKKTDNAYYFQSPYVKFFEIVKEFGEPDAINSMSLGTAIWDSTFLGNKKSIYKRIQIIDEEIYKTRPYSHIGFLYTTIDLHIPYSKIGQVLSISSDITYDAGKHELTARGMSFSYCNALLALACQYVNGQLSWYNISGNNKPREYLSIKNLTNERKREENINIIKNIVNHK